ncbi:MAG: YhdH/YhfP family quinone oxidoreductase [Pseudomonadales bacterium]
MTDFNAFQVEKSDDEVQQSIIQRSIEDLPAGELLIRVRYSSVNYKDALSAKGMPGVTKNYPHTPGIDAAGVVESSDVDSFTVGDEVVVIGFDLGMNTPGGFGEYIRVPANWAVRVPGGLTLKETMMLGTAGFTAALCLEKLERMGASPEDGPVLVTGSTGGVGSVAVSLLAKLGFEVIASSGKSDQVDYLKSLGASSVIGRDELTGESKRPLLAEQWAHGVDTVGGEILSNVIKSLKYGGSVAICGLVASPSFTAAVFPFILRGVNVLGVDSVELPIEAKANTWQRLAGDWKLSNLDDMTSEITLNELSEALDRVFAGQAKGRTLLKHG